MGEDSSRIDNTKQRIDITNNIRRGPQTSTLLASAVCGWWDPNMLTVPAPSCTIMHNDTPVNPSGPYSVYGTTFPVDLHQFRVKAC